MVMTPEETDPRFITKIEINNIKEKTWPCSELALISEIAWLVFL